MCVMCVCVCAEEVRNNGGKKMEAKRRLSVFDSSRKSTVHNLIYRTRSGLARGNLPQQNSSQASPDSVFSGVFCVLLSFPFRVFFMFFLFLSYFDVLYLDFCLIDASKRAHMSRKLCLAVLYLFVYTFCE